MRTPRGDALTATALVALAMAAMPAAAAGDTVKGDSQNFAVTGGGQFLLYVNDAPNSNVIIDVERKGGKVTGKIILNPVFNSPTPTVIGKSLTTASLGVVRNVDCAVTHNGAGYTDVVLSGTIDSGLWVADNATLASGVTSGTASLAGNEWFGILRFKTDGSVERSDWHSEFESCMAINSGLLINPGQIGAADGYAPYVSTQVTGQTKFADCAGSYRFAGTTAFPRCDKAGIYEKLAITGTCFPGNGNCNLNRRVPAGQAGATMTLTIR